MKTKLISLVVATSAMISAVCVADNGLVAYPEGYRHWVHLKSMIIEPGHALENPFQGIHHVYANPKAMKGQLTGYYDNGSVLVFDLLDYHDANNTIQEADRKLIGVMQKDDQKYTDTGGWGFEAFAADSKSKRLTDDGGKGCFSCHASKEDSGYVYSSFRK